MKTYAGLRHADGSCSVAVNGQPLDLRLDVVNHNPTGFEWGFEGSGPAHLALAILTDYLGAERKEVALFFYQKYKDEVVSVLPSSSWELTEEEVRVWLNRNIKVVRVWRYFWEAFTEGAEAKWK